MNCLVVTLAALLLTIECGPVASAQPVVAVRASIRSCRVGHPVTLTLQAVQPAGTTIRWNLIDEKIAADTAVAILRVSNRQLRNATVRHEVVFTRAQGGSYDSGLLYVLRVKENAAPDTLTVPGIRIRFQPEASRFALHSLQPIISLRQSGLLSGTEVLGLAILVVGTGGGLWLVFRQTRGQESRAKEFRTPTHARQQTLLAMEVLERNLAAGPQASRAAPEQLYHILTAYLAQEHADDEPASSVDSRSPRLLADEQTLAGRVNFNGLLSELRNVRFAPSHWGADVLPELLARARELVRADETVTVPEKP